MIQVTFDSLLAVHSRLYARFRKSDLNLQALTGCRSVTDPQRAETYVVAYTRPETEARIVESLMGRDVPGTAIDVYRHPVIELRATNDGLAIELVISKDAWLDQENLLGKLSIDRHRLAFRKMLYNLSGDYRLGFWRGTHLDDMHLTSSQLAHPTVFDQWMSTFSPRQDWFRIGMWYEKPVPSDELARDLFTRTQELYQIYTFAAWTGNNNYRDFYSNPPSHVAH